MRRSSVLIMVATLALACGDKAEEPAAAPPAEAKSDGAEAPAEPPPKPLEEGLVLESPGEGELAPLAMTPGVGVDRRFTLAVRVNRRSGPDKAPMSPKAIFTLATKLQVGADTKLQRGLEIQSIEVPEERKVAPEAVQAMRKALAPLLEVRGAVISDATGKVTQVDLKVPERLLPEGQATAAAVRQALTHMTIPLPTEPVGVGATWEVTRRVDLHGMQAWEVDRYTLTKRDGRQIEITSETTFPSEKLASVPIGIDALAKVSSINGGGKITTRFDLGAAAPIETHVGFAVELQGQGEDGGALDGKIGLDFAIDEIYDPASDERVALRGTFTQGGLIHGSVPAGTKVWFRRKRVKVNEEGQFLLGFGRDAKRRALLSFKLPDGGVERHVVHIERRVYEPERIDDLPPEMVDLDRETRRELAKSRTRVEKVRSKVTKTAHYQSGWRWPVRGRITSTYGRQRILNGKEKGFHWGVDIAGPSGKKIKSPAAGVVVFAEEDVPLSGNLMIIDHGHGLTSSFLHLKRFKAKVGQTVRKGQVVAELGNTGRTTGPHLDWRMNLGDLRIDPQLVMESLAGRPEP